MRTVFLKLACLLLCTTTILGLPKLSPVPPGPSALKQRIINGEIADVGAHPHQVSLQYELLPDLWFAICGGSVIGKEFVLTAAHCVDYDEPQLYRVVINDHNLYNGFVGNEQVLKVSIIYPHEEYINGIDEYSHLYPHDVAVLKLSGEIEDSSTVIEMATSEQDGEFDGKSCVISGWGITETGSSSEELREVNMTVLTEEECNQYMYPYIFQGHICIFSGENNVTGASACNGDSGGPLVCDGFLVGVTSWGLRGCRNADGSFEPSIYARVSYYYEWIRMQLLRFSMGRG